MQFYFIRHAQSVNNHLYDTTGSSAGRNEDPELTETGRRQAETLARFLRQTDPTFQKPSDRWNLGGFGITQVYTSLMARAVSTASIIGRALNLAPMGWEDLHEGGGIYLDDPESGNKVGRPGKNRAYFAAHYPELILPPSFNDAGWWNRPFEEYAQMFPRAERVLNDLLARHGNTEDRVAVISHGGFYNVLLRTIFKIGRDDVWFEKHNAAITRIDFGSGEAVLVYLNRIDFMPKELVT
ncbi:MAG: histidine phosphatase family protein [Chloroflexi bacterium]|nr:histidine phosphatase family protein [Chloroflexota bacterium]